MNLKNRNIGIPLSKEQQKAVRGGVGCMAGQWVDCYCEDGSVEPSSIMPQGEIPIAWCNRCGACSAHGGTSYAGDCM
jgi:hypothetical protein